VQSAEAPARRARDNGNYRFARLGDRFVAYVLDLALLFGLFAVIDAWTFMRWGRVDENEIQLTTASILIAVLLNAAILFLYGWLLEAAFGATLGKAMVGIRVVGTTQRGPMSSCALRNVLRIVDGLAFYLVGTVVAACSDIGQRVGDIFAQTAVIEDSFGTSRRLAAVVLWIAIIGGAGWTVPHICSSNSSKPTPYLNQVALRVGRTQTTAYFRLANFSIDVQLAPQQ
jgi:uncharacterized RDD family membrane protein YckC